MKLLLEVMANKLSHSKQGLLLDIQDLFVNQDIGVPVNVECTSYLIDFSLVKIEEVIFNLRKVQLTNHRSLILNCTQNCVEKFRIIYIFALNFLFMGGSVEDEMPKSIWGKISHLACDYSYLLTECELVIELRQVLEQECFDALAILLLVTHLL
jgi:hypothetical protein